MCRFFSWKDVKGADGKIHHLHLDDKALFKADGSDSDEAKKLKKAGSRDRDFMGHGSICAYYGVRDDETGEHENQDIWDAKKFPRELRPKFKDAETVIRNFGAMLKAYAPLEDLVYIFEKAPESWQALRQFILDFRVPILLKSLKQAKFTITARRDKTIKELIEMGKCQFADHELNDTNFPSEPGEASREEAILLHFDTPVFIGEVQEVVKRLGLVDGGPKELLSFGIDHPNEQREYPVVALLSSCVIRGGRCVPSLGGWGGRRSLGLAWWRGGWRGRCRFLAFRKVS